MKPSRCGLRWNPLEILPVKDKRDLQAFIDLPYQLYRKDKLWIAPLRAEQKAQYDLAKNPMLDHCQYALFLARREGRVVGRISAFNDRLALEHWQQPIGLFGSFECIKDAEVAQGLLGAARDWLREQGMQVMRGPWSFASQEWGLVVDGLFGIGLERDLTGRYRELVEHVNRLDRPVLALDVPSGLDGDTGVARGAAVLADCTVAFIALKPGLFTLDGPDCCGEILLRTLGLDGLDLPGPPGHLLETSAVERLLPPRRRNSHKGSYGSVAVVGGAESKAGAALLAGRAAPKRGGGRV